MKDKSLLITAIVLITLGVTGISAARWLGYQRPAGMPPMMDMMMNRGMMGQGMMNREQMKEMMEKMMPGMLPPGIKPENLPDPNGHGAKLLNRYCAQCHYLPAPGMHTAQEWPTVASRMFAREAMMSGMMGIESPSSEDRQTIVAYLKAYSLRSISPGKLPSPESKGAILFKETCSQCHALPDPALHTAPEWGAVVERMRKNERTMGKKVASEEVTKEIVRYLAAHSRKE